MTRTRTRNRLVAAGAGLALAAGGLLATAGAAAAHDDPSHSCGILEPHDDGPVTDLIHPLEPVGDPLGFDLHETNCAVAAQEDLVRFLVERDGLQQVIRGLGLILFP